MTSPPVDARTIQQQQLPASEPVGLAALIGPDQAERATTARAFFWVDVYQFFFPRPPYCVPLAPGRAHRALSPAAKGFRAARGARGRLGPSGLRRRHRPSFPELFPAKKKYYFPLIFEKYFLIHGEIKARFPLFS